ncbi:DUF1674 domain-containing protein [Nitratireductor indicus]|uniref:DUF1674 domain-containing protein n=1 Tax=Nitratireductor indicus TaxID=721133 RepID=UPI00287476AF|nr:DUF1674 domain-containing protein [Nitratireductor indicus]MDS1136673.1 DUF1674 domain-containing protein [Nitratireductor indicus]
MMGNALRVFNIPVSEGRSIVSEDTENPASAVPAKTLSAAARRALAEAEARREDYKRQADANPKELGGRGGHDPARYGDWEVKGIATDF